MRKWLLNLRPGTNASRKLLMAVVLLGISAGAFYFGRLGAPQASAQNGPQSSLLDRTIPVTPGEYENRVVAYLYENIPITRAELGEYLIARFGVERVEFLVNRRIVETECKARGIYVTDAEVQAQLAEDVKSFKISLKDFTNQVLKKFNKTLYEWKEDVIRPKLAMTKLCRAMVSVTDKDLQEAFDMRYGPKVQCRMIVLQKGDTHKVAIWEKVSKSEEAFSEYARKQFIPNLAATAGAVPPIHKHFGDVRIETEAFSLKEGQVSSLMDMKDGTCVILRCEKHIPRDNTKSLDSERVLLYKDIHDAKVALEIPKAFDELRKKANPKILLAAEHSPASEWEQSVRRDLGIGQPQLQAPIPKK